MDPAFLAAKWAAALDYEPYLATGTPEQQRRWGTASAAMHLTDPQKELLGTFTRQMRVLTISGIWCGDCVEQVPMLEIISKASNGKVLHKLVDRDVHKDLSNQWMICGGHRVPTVLFLNEDCEFCGVAGDRVLSRYRAKAARDLGASCSTGLIVPPAEQVAATLADWVDEVERVQLMLRLSPKYRQKYGD